MAVRFDSMQREPEVDRLRVLVVEDDATIRSALHGVLARAGFAVAEAEDGEAGLEGLVSGDFDAAVVDVATPRLSGPEVVARAKEAGVTTEIVMMPTSGDLEVTVAAVKAAVEHRRLLARRSHASIDIEDLLEVRYASAKAQAIARFNDVYLGALMKRAGNSLSEAARQSGLDRSNFRRLLRTTRRG